MQGVDIWWLQKHSTHQSSALSVRDPELARCKTSFPGLRQAGRLVVEGVV